MEADFQRVYGIDLVDVWRGVLTFRRAATLALTLPAGSALWQATGGPRAWTDEYAGLMGVVHRLDILAWQQTEDGQKGRKQPTPPAPPTWFEAAETRESSALSKAERFLARERARREQPHSEE